MVMMFAFAIHNYVQGMPPMTGWSVHGYVPQFVNALVDDKQVAREVIAFHSRAVNVVDDI
jgi:hypothetical protein